jgi:hypothetical protein
MSALRDLPYSGSHGTPRRPRTRRAVSFSYLSSPPEDTKQLTSNSDRLSRLLLASDAESSPLAACSRVDVHGGAGEVGRKQNDRCVDSYCRSTLVASGSLHTACPRHEATHREAEIAFAQPAATAPCRTQFKENCAWDCRCKPRGVLFSRNTTVGRRASARSRSRGHIPQGMGRSTVSGTRARVRQDAGVRGKQ